MQLLYPLEYFTASKKIFTPTKRKAIAAKPWRSKSCLLFAFLLTVTSATAQSNFDLTNTRITNGSYADIAATGTVISMTNPETGTSTSPQEIGFSFVFNGTTFTQFTIHADGIMRLGSSVPSGATFIAANNGLAMSNAFSSTATTLTNCIMPLFTDLVAGANTPAFHVATTGTAPNRICTVQWKGLRDADNSLSDIRHQFEYIEFQVKLYETTNNIEIVYGNWQPSVGPIADQRRNAAVGIKAASTSFIAALRFNSLFPVARSEFITSLNNSLLANAFPYRQSVKPANGQTISFFGQLTNDVGVGRVYYDSTLVKGQLARGQVAALVRNYGTAVATNVAVSLQASGANAFVRDTVIASLAAGASSLVTFANADIPNNGLQTFTVTATAAGDERVANNLRSQQQVVNNNYTQVYNAANNAGVGVGFNGVTSQLGIKMYNSGPSILTQIRLPFGSYRSRVRVSIYAENPATGNPVTPALFVSQEFFTTNENVFRIPVPGGLNIGGNYFIGVEQLNTTNMGWVIAVDNPLRTDRFRTGASLVPTTNNEPWMVLAETFTNQAQSDVGIENMVDIGCRFDTLINLKATLRNFSSNAIDFAANPVQIQGNVVHPSGAVTAFTHTKNTGTLAANAAMPIDLVMQYNMQAKGQYNINAKTILPGDAAPQNDSLRFFFNNSLRLTAPVADSICPLTPVTITPPGSFYANRTFMYDSQSGNVTGNILLMPEKTTTVFFTGTDYRDCVLRDSVVVPVKSLGLPPAPVIVFGDTVLGHRRAFKDTVNVVPPAGHTVSFLTNILGTINTNPTQFNTIQGLNGLQVRPVLTRTSDNCSSIGNSITYSYGTGVVHGANASVMVADTNYYDDGGALGQTNATGTQVFFPADPAQKLQLKVYLLSVFGSRTITIHDGSDASAPVLGTLGVAFNGTTIRTFKAANPQGALTVVVSGSSGGDGWYAGITQFKPVNFRSRQNGLWNQLITWEQQEPDGSFVNALSLPDASEDTITVRHAVDLNIPLRLDQVIVEPAGVLTINMSSPRVVTAATLSPQLSFDIRGRLIVIAGNTIDGGTMAISGALENYGIMNVPAVVFNGSSLQEIGVGGGAEGIMMKMIADNPAGIRFRQFMRMSGLELKQGIILSDASGFPKLTNLNPVVGANATRYIDGPMSIVGTIGQRFYPIGKNGAYRPVTITNNSSVSQAADEIRVEIINGAPPARSLPPSVAAVSNVRYAQVFRLGSAGTGYTISMAYGPEDNVADPSKLTVAQNVVANAWTDIGGTANGSPSGQIVSGSFNTLAFHDFVIAGKDGALPVTGLWLTATKARQAHALVWHTLTERNAAHFVVQHSTNGNSFSDIGKTVAAGNSDLRQQYQFVHTGMQQAGNHFYRLKQVDVDGRTAYSNTALISYDDEKNPFIVMPNPVRDVLTHNLVMQSGTRYQLMVYNMAGQLCLAKTVTSNSIDISQLKRGAYRVIIWEDKVPHTANIIKL